MSDFVIKTRPDGTKVKVRKVKKADLNDPAKVAKMAEEANAELPPPGDWRKEALKMRQDELEQAASVASKALIGGSAVVPLTDIPIENEIARHFKGDELPISNALDSHVYAWICYDSPSTAKGTMVRQQLLLKGWEVVQGTSESFPEGKEYLQADGTRKVGDTILMRCRKDYYLQHKLMERQNRMELHARPDGRLDGITDIVQGVGGIKLRDVNLDDPQMVNALNRAHARALAEQQFTSMLKSGTIPGREVHR